MWVFQVPREKGDLVVTLVLQDPKDPRDLWEAKDQVVHKG